MNFSLYLTISSYFLLVGCISSAIWVGSEIVRQGEPEPNIDQEYEDLSVYLDPSADTIYTVQLGAYSSRDIALKSLDGFGSLEEELWILEREVNEKDLVLILYGRFLDRRAAVLAADSLKQTYPDMELWLRVVSSSSLQSVRN